MSEAKSTKLRKPNHATEPHDGDGFAAGISQQDGAPHNNFDAIQAMLDEEPLSLAEEIVEECERTGKPLSRDDVSDRYNQIKQGDIHIAELQRMTMPQLIEQARSENLTD